MCPIYFYPKSSLWSKDIHHGIPGALVTGFDINYSYVATTFTASNGQYNLTSGLDIFLHPVNIAAFGANATSYGQNNSFGSSTNISLTAFPDNNYSLSNQTVNNTQLYDARNYITAGNNYIVAPSNGNVTFIAGKSVDLTTGFDAEQGTYFDAKYGFPVNCSNVAAGEPSGGRYMSGGGDNGGSSSSSNNLFSFLLKEPFSVTDSTPSVYISPNPTFTGVFTVYVSNPNDFKEIRIIDMLGNTVVLIANPVEKNNIALTNFPRGIYAVKISGNKSVFIRKIIYE